MDLTELRIALWNFNGILKRKHEIELFLYSQNIDVRLITETHITNQTYLKFHGYQSYQSINPRNQVKGGSTILIKDNINHDEEC